MRLPNLLFALEERQERDRLLPEDLLCRWLGWSWAGGQRGSWSGRCGPGALVGVASQEMRDAWSGRSLDRECVSGSS